MNLINYNNKKTKLIDADGNIFIGMTYYSDAETNETSEDVLIVKKGTEYYEILESDIKSIEIVK